MGEAPRLSGGVSLGLAGYVPEVPQPRYSDERLTAVRTLLAEEARMGMMVGVAVGWALAEELHQPDESNQED